MKCHHLRVLLRSYRYPLGFTSPAIIMWSIFSRLQSIKSCRLWKCILRDKPKIITCIIYHGYLLSCSQAPPQFFSIGMGILIVNSIAGIVMWLCQHCFHFYCLFPFAKVLPPLIKGKAHFMIVVSLANNRWLGFGFEIVRLGGWKFLSSCLICGLGNWSRIEG